MFGVVSCLFVCFYVLAIPDYWPVVPKYGSLSLHLNDCQYRDDERSMGSKRTYPKQHPEKKIMSFVLTINRNVSSCEDILPPVSVDGPMGVIGVPFC